MEHYGPPPPEVVQRFRFNSRSRQPGESIVMYAADLWQLAEQCNFSTTLDKMIRDRLVHWINDERICEWVLQEKDLMYKRVVTLAQGVEEATKNLKEMSLPHSEPLNTTAPVHKIQSKNPADKSQGITCHCCGAPGRFTTTCQFQNCNCFKCGKKGHFGKGV